MILRQAQYARPFEVCLEFEKELLSEELNTAMNQVSNHNAKHALHGEAGAGVRAVNAAHVDCPCGAWSYVSFDMLRTDLVTIQGDPGSSG